jgi:hypothetical protein
MPRSVPHSLQFLKKSGILAADAHNAFRARLM